MAAHGVFTAPLEWIALAAASGAEVHIKAPVKAPGLCHAFTRFLTEEGLPVSCSTDRQLASPDTIIAFGNDSTMEKLRSTYPEAHICAYGHRFSIVITDGSSPRKIARDISACDTRGCMAPAGVFVLGESARFEEQIAEELAGFQQSHPCGSPGPFNGSEWRRRSMLALAKGRLLRGEKWAVMRLPPEMFIPSPLTRTACIYSVGSLSETRTILAPWMEKLSSVALDIDGREMPIEGMPRVCPVGELQRPVFPREHDGFPMWASVAPLSR